MAKTEYHSRKFLNKSSGMAAIECKGSVTDWSLDLGIDISDCSRKVSLDFYAHTPKQCKELLNKLDLLLSEIAKARVFYEEAIPVYTEQYNKHKEVNKLRKSRNKEKYVSLDELLSEDND